VVCGDDEEGTAHGVIKKKAFSRQEWSALVFLLGWVGRAARQSEIYFLVQL
jgi:hypothetical protein